MRRKVERLPHPGLLVVQSGRSPHSVSICVALIGVAIYSVFFVLPSSSLEDTLDPFQLVAYSVLTMLGAGSTLFGVYYPQLLPGLLMERVGQMMLAVTSAVYIISVTTISTVDKSGLVLAIAGAIAVGSAWRVIRITLRELPVVREWMEKIV